ncbi:OmpA family protein [Dyadobacter subterraneus]|uniref:OmpA family protein n=1 Tax=Dyadobacter subterraneus TaxID=2773304 RepID=A0ABR9W8C8_9BACT|nr:OmpA family protein [Dyadobacter subterraneus]MBE9461409.1 OmpA family protein [Dyadobacter subterraneus]
MKKFLLVLLVSVYISPVNAQLLDRIRNKVEQKVGDKIDQSIDKATQKKKPKDNPSSTETTSQTNSSQENATVAAPAKEMQKSDPVTSTVQDINSYSKFDFIAGEKVIVHEDFSEEALGDFPSNWNTRSSAELVTINNREGKWMRLAQTGIFYPEYITSNLPENFTLQMELLANQQVASIGQWMISIIQTKDINEKFKLGESLHESDVANFKLCFQPASSGNGQMYYSTNLIGSQSKSGVPEFNVPGKPSVKISIWRQKQRVRVYLDSTKVLDLPRALDANAALNTLIFSSSNPEYQQKEGAFFMGNIQLSVGAPNLRSKLVSEGKFSTNGILFDVNSDQIKPQSYGSLQDVALLLKENSALRVTIIGHTDADGNDAANLDLSKRRAISVAKALTTTFGIDSSRLETNGKGKEEPVDSNDTPAGKANNRRVEFIKIK